MMFDEYNEGNQIAKTAEDASMSPAGTSSTLFTLNQDGASCSSDYYLRLTHDGGRMLKGEMPLTAVRPTSPASLRLSQSAAAPLAPPRPSPGPGR